MRKWKGPFRFVAACLSMAVVLACAAFSGAVGSAEADPGELTGGGYAATGQVRDASYTSEFYDETNGLPTSDAFAILGARNGYIWIGGYSGIIRYDGTSFERLDTADGLTSGRGFFEDRKGRIWVATNDNGVVILNGKERIHITSQMGLPSSSIRTFAEDSDGNIFIGTTAGVCFVDPQMTVHGMDDERINEARVLRLVSDGTGRICGQTSKGLIFAIEDCQITEVYESGGLGMEKITTILADPKHDGKVFLGTEGGNVYYGDFGADAAKMERISAAPLESVHWMSYDCGRVWVASTTRVGYMEEDRSGFRVLNDLPMTSAIEMMTSDFQGNMWFASSTQGVLKVITSQFVNVSRKAGLEDEVANAACLFRGVLYIGTDKGLRIIGSDGRPVENALTAYVGDARIRCISEDTEGNLWLSAFNNDLGVVCFTKDGEIRNYTTEDGLLNHEIRCCLPAKDGAVMAATNGGLAVIRNGAVERTIGAEDGLKNTVILTVAEGDQGEIYAGTDGDGIYVIKGSAIERLGREDGLTSDVITRIKKDEKHGVLWIITSNSIQYMKEGEIRQVKSFPFNNNYDLCFDDHQNMWIISSFGIYKVSAREMLEDDVTDYRLYTLENGLAGAPTYNLYSALDEEGNLYIPERNGICRININRMTGERAAVKTAINSIWCGDTEIVPDERGIYTIPNTRERIRITASVLDYSLMNPSVRVYFEGKEEDGLAVGRADLVPLEYTDLSYGNYTLHVQAADQEGNVLVDDVYRIEKQPRMTELPVLQFGILAAVAAIAGFLVWRIMKGTVIQRQYKELKRAKEETEQASQAKTRFLANMSNGLRTPINTIMGMNEMAMREDAAGVPGNYYTSMMNYAVDVRNASESLLSMVNDLFDLSEIESGKMRLSEQEYEPYELFRSIVSTIRPQCAKKELKFDVTIDEMLPGRLYGDVRKIKQILLNLLTNAVKYTEIGMIALSVSMEERKNDECTIRFSVKDTGLGIRKEDVEKIFSAYEHLDEEQDRAIIGTGLGLDVSRMFAEILGGSLACESEFGKGSAFMLTVSQKIINPTPAGRFDVTVQDDEKNMKSYVPRFIAPDADILVVDDIPADLKVIRGLLKPTQVFVSTAASGEECMEKIRDTGYDVVFLSLMMQGIDGFETLAKIREYDASLPVYALAPDASRGESFFLSCGFNGFLVKPIRSEMLEKTIMKHLPKEMMDQPGEEKEGTD
ncbi:MAG: response regulator [Clostridia bacterium]|nr:response regulator [Clostridia bacterium]